MKKHIRNWLPCSAFSKFSLGTLTGIVCDLLFPGTALLWIGIFVLAFSIGSLIGTFFKKRIQISEYFIYGIFFFTAATSFYPERFTIERHPKNNFVPAQKKNLFGEPEKRFQEKFRERILLDLKGADLEKNSNRVALGLIFGEAKQLSKEFKTKAKEGGILHLFAASGLHLGILMGVQYRILSLIPSLGHNIPRIIPLLTGFLYLSTLGYPVSLARAWIFAGLLLTQGLFFRKLRAVDLLLCSAWILWISDPSRFYTVSFCLSFGAVAGIFLFSYPIQVVCRFLSDENFLTSFFKENLSISFSAGLGTMPVLLFAFGSFSFGSILLNLLVVPLAGILLPILYLSLLLEETKLTPITEPFWSFTEFLIQILIYLSESLSKPLGFYKEMGDAVWIGMIGWIFLCFETLFFAYVLEKVFPGSSVSNFGAKAGTDPRSDLDKNENENDFLKNIQNSEYSSPNRGKRRIKNLYPILFCLFFITVCGIHILLYRSPDWFPRENKIVNNRFFFILRNGDSLIFSGKCKYGFKTISAAFRTSQKNYCEHRNNRPLEKILVEDESCLTWAFRCLKEHPQTELLYSGRDFEPWSRATGFKFLQSAPLREISLSKTRSGDSSKIVFFHTKKDSLTELAQRTKTGSGWILLEHPYGSKDDSEVWNRNRKLLGLSGSWVFLEKDELQRIPVSESH
ncbi:ComEC/Rec2 family competence protein [Leptospira barantonii]|uniref:Competence protein n=1 Tax=Leptospira barantonii TaxID=2023184 RepID=A0ABX4NLG8_9LEPT|nr:ComEC/Rec2 family competence protein [Leptospira barantonii]PJZ57649.1 competence protein [Leptospira barantonii]